MQKPRGIVLLTLGLHVAKLREKKQQEQFSKKDEVNKGWREFEYIFAGKAGTWVCNKVYKIFNDWGFSVMTRKIYSIMLLMFIF